MNEEKLLDFRQGLGEISSKYCDLIGDESANLEREYGIVSTENLKKDLDDIKDAGRILQIGIVGRVKAGKSSLLNALLFDGRSILPKAATPMTAALTILSYGEDMSAEVDFFSDDDIDNIRADHDRYKVKVEKLAQEKLENLKNKKKASGHGIMANVKKKIEKQLTGTDEKQLEKLRSQAQREVKRDSQALSAAYDHYERIRGAGNVDRNLNIIKAGDINELKKKLMDYIGADGRYMPFTKSVRIRLPQDKLKGIQIVDTPGINDPVQSREERTRELLKYCDVIFIVSPSGQFLSNEDTELLDRITSRDGVNELCVVASQVDNQLFGSEKEKYDGDLDRVLIAITSVLGEHMSDTLSALKSKNPEIGDTFDQLIKSGKKKVLHSSGICRTISRQFDDREAWDDGVRHVWDNLSSEYPDYFSDSDKKTSIASLEKLANISAMNALIESVSKKKDEILKKRSEDFVRIRFEALKKYHDGLTDYVNNQMEQIKNADVDGLKQQLKNMEKKEKKASLALNEDYQDNVEELQGKIKNGLSRTLNSYFKETRKSVDDSEQTETEEYTVDKGRGVLFWRSLTGNRYETRTRTQTTVRAGAVKSSLDDLTNEIENTVADHAQTTVAEWRKALQVAMTKTLRANIDDDDLEPLLIKRAVRNVINKVEYPQISFGTKTSLSKAAGTLKGSEAERFLDEARDYLTDLRKRVNNAITDYSKTLAGRLTGLDLPEMIFSDYKKKLHELEKQIENSGMILERFEKITRELEVIK